MSSDAWWRRGKPTGFALSSVALAELSFGPEEKVGYGGLESLLQGDLACVNPVAARHEHDHPPGGVAGLSVPVSPRSTRESQALGHV